ncbi:hypothetical protein Syn7803C72_78 [Synechococcus phage ACG-2014d]|jgi:hypothetical protein|uniref:Uncharacterized protein n=1 Tax=Synechococcus phage ACG-2014d TaxID=1493509 RepID=A0A0E3HE15_9CAUD|nr:hypothetical protein AAJ59_gp078 [Synechococcus phage ACG-2014d]YP_010355248.1 hypothetical protein M1M12_gp079 [Synechococcus phage ACG-2014d]AIX14690.1 hypothetical protein Syn7803C45_79 [Synechococcus phage ACG-2014d]AIX14909.1 hypothetical protein Syn7803C46_78 [Synechococcus phage ACG-2014d]AIX15336.1 hypothetical protein Syn7803C48_78 [Synechococcus phage ACG-2014d]AIX15554.1 hypothetical protein Syn7803C49_78 [Synechococcus phage ACG-2014d]AIX15983.1 hypothetical protein Syn7803C54_
MTVEKVTQEDMLAQFKERYETLIKENAQLAEKVKQNEMQALKLQGAIETLTYIADSGEEESPSEETEE